MTVSKQYQICFEIPLLPVFTGKSGGCSLFPLSAGLLILNKFVQKICFLLSGRFTLSEVCRLSDMRCRGVATGQLQYSGCVSNLQGELCSFEHS